MALTKALLKQQLEAFLKGLEEDRIGEYGYYRTLYLDTVVAHTDAPEWQTERAVAREAVQYPELHGLMRMLVDRITLYNRPNPLWANDTEHAGAGPALELALANEGDIDRYVQYLVSNDLNHEVYQQEDIDAILERWGIGMNTYPLLVARWFAPGQFGQEQIGGYLDIMKERFEDPVERDAFIAACAKWFQTHAEDKEEVNSLFSALFEEVQYFEEYDDDGDDEDFDEEAIFGPVVGKFFELVSQGEIPAFADLL